MDASASFTSARVKITVVSNTSRGNADHRKAFRTHPEAVRKGSHSHQVSRCPPAHARVALRTVERRRPVRDERARLRLRSVTTLMRGAGTSPESTSKGTMGVYGASSKMCFRTNLVPAVTVASVAAHLAARAPTRRAPPTFPTLTRTPARTAEELKDNIAQGGIPRTYLYVRVTFTPQRARRWMSRQGSGFFFLWPAGAHCRLPRVSPRARREIRHPVFELVSPFLPVKLAGGPFQGPFKVTHRPSKSAWTRSWMMVSSAGDFLVRADERMRLFHHRLR